MTIEDIFLCVAFILIAWLWYRVDQFEKRLGYLDKLEKHAIHVAMGELE